jgi:hypothetical protein
VRRVQWRRRGSSWLFYLRRGGLPHPHIDGLGLFFALLITSIGTLVLIEAGSYLAGHHHLGRFYIYLLTFMAAMLQTAPRGGYEPRDVCAGERQELRRPGLQSGVFFRLSPRHGRLGGSRSSRLPSAGYPFNAGQLEDGYRDLKCRHRYGLKFICIKINYLHAFMSRPNFVFLSQSCSRISRRAFALKSYGLYIPKNTKIHRF